MEISRPDRRPRAASVIGIVVGAIFLALGVAAFFVGGGPIVGAIALTGGVLTVAASVYTLVRP
jgi:hypothetical protein